MKGVRDVDVIMYNAVMTNESDNSAEVEAGAEETAAKQSQAPALASQSPEQFCARNHLEQETAAYIARHWQRYLHVLELLPQGQDKLKILEIGTSEPFPFLNLLSKSRPQAELSAVMEPEPGQLRRTAKLSADEQAQGHSVDVAHCDIDRDHLPWREESFDIVFAMEIIEHLMLNPLQMVREACRVLKPGGLLIMTTPNIAGAESLQKLLEGHAPYGFGQFTLNGAYGRHNREYTPHEIEAMARATGFETKQLTTIDCYDESIDARVARQLLAVRGADMSLRRQNIVYCGTKRHYDAVTYPDGLYPDKLQAYSASLRLIETTARTAEVEIANTGSLTWSSSADYPVMIALRWKSHDGKTELENGRMPLPNDVAPGEMIRVSIPLTSSGTGLFSRLVQSAKGGSPHGELTIDLVHEYHCWFGRSGLTRPLRLPAHRSGFDSVATAGSEKGGRVVYTPEARSPKQLPPPQS